MHLRHHDDADPCRCKLCRHVRKEVIKYLVRMGPKELASFLRGARRLGLQITLDNTA